jgi:hypothetical protein
LFAAPCRDGSDWAGVSGNDAAATGLPIGTPSTGLASSIQNVESEKENTFFSFFLLLYLSTFKLGLSGKSGSLSGEKVSVLYTLYSQA